MGKWLFGEQIRFSDDGNGVVRRPLRPGVRASVLKVACGGALAIGLGSIAWVAGQPGSAEAAINVVNPVVYTTAPVRVPLVNCAVTTGTQCVSEMSVGAANLLEGDSLVLHAGNSMCAAITDEVVDRPTRYYVPDPSKDQIGFKALRGSFSSNVSTSFVRPQDCGPDVGGHGTWACQAQGLDMVLTIANASAAWDNVRVAFAPARDIFPYTANPTGLDEDASNLCTVAAGIRTLKPQLKLTKEVCLYSGGAWAKKACDVDEDQVWVKDVDPASNYPDGTTVYWRIVVANTGNTDLQGVKLSSDTAVALPDASGKLADDATDSCLNTPLDPLSNASKGANGTVNLKGGSETLDDGATFAQGGRAAVVCSTEVEENFTGTIKNEAQAEGTFSELDINKRALVDRLPGGKVSSNPDSATATIYTPHVKLTKEVCSTGTGCANGSNPKGTWVDSTMVRRDTPVEWRLTVMNDGAVPVSDLLLVKDELTGGDESETLDGCDVGQRFTDPEGGGLLRPGESFSFVCGTPKVSSDVKLVNTAQAYGQPRNPKDLSVPLPGFADRSLATNEDSARVVAANPSITLKKYACAKGTGCEVPIVPFDAAKLDTEMWLDTEDGQTPSHVLVPNNGAIQWLIVATNSGTTPLSDVTLSKDWLSGNDEGIASTCEPGTAFPLPEVSEHKQLVKGASTAIECASSPIPATIRLIDTVNTAQASAVPVLLDGVTVVAGYSADDPVESNTDIAKAAAVDMKLTLKKYACQRPSTGAEAGAATGCPVPDSEPVTAEALADAGWMDTDQPGDHVIVQSGKPVDWLIVVQNNGNVPVSAVEVITDKLTAGVDQDVTTDEDSCLGAMSVLGQGELTLVPSGFAVKQCTTTSVEATSPPSELVNSAVAAGMPMDPDDPDAKLNGAGTAPLQSDPNPARAEAASPAIGLSKWVCSAGQSCTEDEFKSPADPGQWVKRTETQIGRGVSWLIVVTNTGNVPLKGVTLTAEALTAAALPVRAADGEACAAAFGSQGLQVGHSASAMCHSQSLAAAESPLVNTARAGGTDPFGEPAESDPDSATVEVKPPTSGPPPGGGQTLPPTGPGVSITKQVCLSGSQCDVKNDTDWVGSTTQPAGKKAVWRIVVANTGTEPLRQVRVADVLSGTRAGSEASCELAFGSTDLLQPGYKITYVCSSAAVSRSESGLVNTARVTATGATSGNDVTTRPTSATVLVQGGGGALPRTGFAALTLAAVALLLIATGAGGLWLRRTVRGPIARHIA